jgi:hypothetical protein
MSSVPHFPPPPPLPASSVKAIFSGDRGEFRGLVERGTGLELVTFGFYRFWLPPTSAVICGRIPRSTATRRNTPDAAGNC